MRLAPETLVQEAHYSRAHSDTECSPFQSAHLGITLASLPLIDRRTFDFSPNFIGTSSCTGPNAPCPALGQRAVSFDDTSKMIRFQKLHQAL